MNQGNKPTDHGEEAIKQIGRGLIKLLAAAFVFAIFVAGFSYAYVEYILPQAVRESVTRDEEMYTFVGGLLAGICLAEDVDKQSESVEFIFDVWTDKKLILKHPVKTWKAYNVTKGLMERTNGIVGNLKPYDSASVSFQLAMLEMLIPFNKGLVDNLKNNVDERELDAKWTDLERAFNLWKESVQERLGNHYPAAYFGGIFLSYLGLGDLLYSAAEQADIIDSALRTARLFNVIRTKGCLKGDDPKEVLENFVERNKDL